MTSAEGVAWVYQSFTKNSLLKETLNTKWEDLKKLFIVTIASINAQCYKCLSLKAWHPPHTDFIWLWHITVTHARNQCVCSKTGENDISGGQQQRWSFALEYVYLKNSEIIHCIWKQWLLECLQAKMSSVHIKSGEMYSSLGINTPFAPFAKLKNACKVMLWIHLSKARRKSFHYQGKPAESWPTQELLPCSAPPQQATDCSYIPGSPCAARVWQNTLQFMLNIPHTQWLHARNHHGYTQEVFYMFAHTYAHTLLRSTSPFAWFEFNPNKIEIEAYFQESHVEVDCILYHLNLVPLFLLKCCQWTYDIW